MMLAGGDRRILRHVPWGMLALVLTISIISVVNLVSASRAAHAPVWRDQIVWIVAGLTFAFTMLAVDYRWLHRLAWPFYVFVLVLLVLVEVSGKTTMGAQRWLVLGGVRLGQPSELAKIAVILVLARYFHEEGEKPEGHSLVDLIKPGLILAVPFVLILHQPDLGTAALCLATGGTIVLASKVKWTALVTTGVAGLGAAVAAWFFVLHDYQKRRVLTFLDPEGDALGAGYHANQSMIAVGSGQWAGKGWTLGTQTQLSFLPEQHTDFAFSVFAEEWGFRGGVVLIALFLGLILAGLRIAVQARDRHGTFLAVGCTGLLFWHAFVNMGMVTGMLPVVGVTLPLISYGGSSAITVMIVIGILANVAARRNASYFGG